MRIIHLPLILIRRVEEGIEDGVNGVIFNGEDDLYEILIVPLPSVRLPNNRNSFQMIMNLKDSDKAYGI
jgi:hypothetical protein